LGSDKKVMIFKNFIKKEVNFAEDIKEMFSFL